MQRTRWHTRLPQTSAPISPSNSGGTLVNVQGGLSGAQTLGAVDLMTGAAANGIRIAITSNHMKEVLKRLEK